jgi:IS5 family transposase
MGSAISSACCSDRASATIAQAHALIEGIEAEAVIADKGYDADHLHDAILDGGAEPVILPKSNRRAPHNYERLPAECLGCTFLEARVTTQKA